MVKKLNFLLNRVQSTLLGFELTKWCNTSIVRSFNSIYWTKTDASVKTLKYVHFIHLTSDLKRELQFAELALATACKKRDHLIKSVAHFVILDIFTCSAFLFNKY